VIAINMVMSEPDRMSHEEILRLVPDGPGPFLLSFSSAEAPIPNLANAAAGVGALNWDPSQD